MGFKAWIIPQEKRFFELLEKQSANNLQAAHSLQDMILNYTDVTEKKAKLKRIEHEGDEIVHEVYQQLVKSFVTPIDHEDISALASRNDDVLDYIYAVANRLHLYEVGQPTDAMKKMADLIVKSVEEVNNLLPWIRRINRNEIDKRCAEINRLENLADDVLNNSVAEIFKQGDPVRIIKLKEIYELMEIVTDKCEDVSDILRDIALKNA